MKSLAYIYIRFNQNSDEKSYISAKTEAVKHLLRALDKREYLVIIWDNFCYFCIKTYVVTPLLNCLIETVQKRGHNILFQ